MFKHWAAFVYQRQDAAGGHDGFVDGDDAADDAAHRLSFPHREHAHLPTGPLKRCPFPLVFYHRKARDVKRTRIRRCLEGNGDPGRNVHFLICNKSTEL